MTAAWVLFAVMFTTNLACYFVGFAIGAARADDDIDDAFDAGQTFGTYRGQP